MKNNPYLTGYFAPVHDELDVTDLKIIGEIPSELTGIYMRNGPNPAFTPITYTYPIDGDGMIHAIYIADGKAHYRNRYVETKGLQKERRAGKALYGGIANIMPMDPEWADDEDRLMAVKNNTSIHIIRHAGQYLALSESSPAYEMTEQLTTIGEWSPVNTSNPLSICAHTRLDPLNGDLWFINYDINPPYLSIYCVNNKGMLIKKIDVEKDYCSMMHDFILTEHYVIVYDSPLIIDARQLQAGGSLIKWRPDLGSRFGVISRHNHSIRWFDSDVFFVFHFANAYEQGNTIMIDFVRHEKGDYFEADQADSSSLAPTLFRTIINLDTAVIRHIPLDDCGVEFPRIKEDRNTLEHQFIYATAIAPDMASKEGFNAIVKYDVKNQISELRTFGPYAQVSEAVFVPAATQKSEDDGFLLLFVFDEQSEQSEFVILDATNPSTAPLARIQMPRRVPNGFHGTWMEGHWTS